jgi:uncharacterized protein (TIGR00369 family)
MNLITEPAELFQRIQASFARQGMMRHLGARLLRVEPGLCVVALPSSEHVTQQQGGLHGGATGALADIAGAKESDCALMQQTVMPVAKTY